MTKFKPEQSSNPRGRPKGALNKVTLATQVLLVGEPKVSGSEATSASVGCDLPLILPPCFPGLAGKPFPDKSLSSDTPKLA
jgi:hypothetical protein